MVRVVDRVRVMFVTVVVWLLLLLGLGLYYGFFFLSFLRVGVVVLVWFILRVVVRLWLGLG